MNELVQMLINEGWSKQNAINTVAKHNKQRREFGLKEWK